MAVIIEVLGTTHNVLERVKAEGQRISIGRAYHNDVILGDEHIDEEHARLLRGEDGRWRIEDLESLNGVRRLKSRRAIGQAEVESGDIFILGRNKIRVLFDDHPVARTVKLRPIETVLLWIGRPQVLLMLGLLYVTMEYLGVVLTATSEVAWGAVVSRQLYSTLGVVLVAVVVYLLSILFKRGGNFLSHLGLLVLIFVLMQLFAVLAKLILFNSGISAPVFQQLLESVSGYVVLFIYLWSILYLAFHLSLKLRTAISVAAVAVLVTLNVLQGDPLAEYRHQQVRVDPTLMPPAFLLRSPEDSATYFADAFGIFAEADEAKRRQLAERHRRTDTASAATRVSADDVATDQADES